MSQESPQPENNAPAKLSLELLGERIDKLEEQGDHNLAIIVNSLAAQEMRILTMRAVLNDMLKSTCRRSVDGGLDWDSYMDEQEAKYAASNEGRNLPTEAPPPAPTDSEDEYPEGATVFSAT